jgi:predicted nucleic acid-binding Zn ribbon protein
MAKTNDHTLGEALNAYLHKSGLDDKERLHYLASHWSEVVGKPIAEQTEEVRFDKGICTIRIKTPAWRHELTLARTQLKDKLNEAAGRAIIREVKVL